MARYDVVGEVTEWPKVHDWKARQPAPTPPALRLVAGLASGSRVDVHPEAVEAHPVTAPGKASKAIASACLALLDAGLTEQARALVWSEIDD